MSSRRNVTWQLLDDLVSSSMGPQHVAQLLTSLLELHAFSRRVIAHYVTTQAGHFWLIERCPQPGILPYTTHRL